MPLPLVLDTSEMLLAPEMDSDLATGQINTPRRATPWRFQASGGSTTTIVSASLTGANAYDYVGNLVRVVGRSDGDTLAAPMEQIRQVVAFNPATDTLTLDDPFTVAIASGMVIEMWVSPEIHVAAEIAGTTTTVEATDVDDASGRPGRNETSNSFANPDRFVLVGYGGANADRAALITTDSGVGATKIFTVEAGVFTGDAAGAYYKAWLPVQQFRGAFKIPTFGQQHLQRGAVKGLDWDGETGLPGPRDQATFTLESLEVSRLNTASAAGIAPQPPADVHDLLASLTTYQAATQSMTAAATGSTTRVDVTDGQMSRVEIGQAVLSAGEAAFILGAAADGVNPDQLTVSPSLSTAPVSGNLIATGCHYSPRVQNFRSWSGELYFGGGAHRRHFHGWLPAFRIEGVGEEGDIARFVFEGPIDFHWHDTATRPAWTTSVGGNRLPTATRVLPQVARAVRCHLAPTAAGAASTTFAALTIRGFSFDAGLNPTKRRAPTGLGNADGGVMAGLKKPDGATFSVLIDMEDSVHVERFERGAIMEFLLQLGASVGGTFAFWCRRAQYIGIDGPTEAEGRWQLALRFKCLASTISATSTGFGSGAVVVPQYVLAFL